MILTTNITLVGGRYGVEVSVPDNALSGAEQDALTRFGEPIVDMGGNITSGNTTVVLPTHQIRVPGQLPYKVQFDHADHGSTAGLLAAEYVDVIRPRIADAIETQMALVPPITLGLTTAPAEPS